MTDRALVSTDEFEQIIALPENRDRLLELIDGEMVEKVTPHEHGILVIVLGAYLLAYVNQHGGTISTETRHQLADDRENSRLPDLSYISAADLQGIVRQGAVPYMPTLAVEIKSPDDSYASIRRKAGYYLERGSQAVWLVFPERRAVEVYHANGDLVVVTEADSGVIDGGAVVPGFRLALSALFSKL